MGTRVGVMFPPSPSGVGCWEPAGCWGARHIPAMLGALARRSFERGMQEGLRVGFKGYIRAALMPKSIHKHLGGWREGTPLEGGGALPQDAWGQSLPPSLLSPRGPTWPPSLPGLRQHMHQETLSCELWRGLWGRLGKGVSCQPLGDLQRSPRSTP